MKRVTKAQREEREIQALEKRMIDMYTAACGAPLEDLALITPGDAVKIIRAVIKLWRIDRDSEEYRVITAFWNLDEWETPRKAAEFLHGRGLRA